jgi:hypothetical protein
MIAYQCSSTGLYYPADYFEQWGRKYGVGLGPVPCSEAWESCYETAPAKGGRDIQSADQLGHGIRVCGAPMFPVNVTEDEYAAGKAVLHSEDPTGKNRWAIVRAIQDKNPRSRRKMSLTSAFGEV